ncbi:ABC transporter ATP-binding protein [Desulfitobacterium chlororespirans]|uniref:Dipeptide transport system ATP-binding protein n=1 Tax=Desulfitobacterium chlororespirans DSM 11544 TaxID=1121395 RepID=A0A1M7TIM3_9FIRM|nr:dipeptide/oligopeptide/nickel ABC transporter ATP-binding protein [Desulfitobacterium chlororespirans]SHN70531.1 dipeptide transport system ATP-binding protein [Desulfitobacterium chlororespirans DSM 11544]
MLKAVDLSKQYTAQGTFGPKHTCLAVDGLSLQLEENTVYALVGESGSGKSTLSRLLAYVERPTGGQLLLDGRPIRTYNARELRQKRRDVQLVLQDGQSSLDPRQTIAQILAEPLKNLLGLSRNEQRERAGQLLGRVGLAAEILGRYPHELSGGQQKRVCIARAIGVSPRLIIFDESISGLDVTLRKQILDLLLALKEEIRCSYLLVTHDLEVALYASQHILVMKDGKIVEKAENIQGYHDFRHPYSQQLVGALLAKRQALP